MEIDRKATASEKAPAEQVAALIGIPAENIQVEIGPDKVRVSIGTLTLRGFKVTGDVPADKADAVRAWAKALPK